MAMKGMLSGRNREGAPTAESEIIQLAAFSVGAEQYALDIMRIKRIINPLPITPVPKAPPFIEGVIELRGVILPMVDMRRRFDLPCVPVTRANKFLIVAIDGRRPTGASASPSQRWIVGLIVDGMPEVVRVTRGEILPAPAMAQSADARYFSGVCHHRGRIAMLIDLEALLSPGELLTLERLGGGRVE